MGCFCALSFFSRPSLWVIQLAYEKHGFYECVSVMRGVGELDVGEQRRGATTRIEPAPYDVTCPYLLLDIRDRDEYDQCHIIPG